MNEPKQVNPATVEQTHFAMLFQELQDATVLSLYRVRYVFKNEVASDGGPLEIRTDSTEPVVLDAGPDGEVLKLSRGAWSDPFSSDLAAENRDYIASHGKWTAFDISEEAACRSVIGSKITDIQFAMADDAPDKILGVRIGTESGSLRADVVCDELIVRFGK